MKGHTRSLTRRRLPQTAQGIIGPCYQPAYWYIVNDILEELGKEPLRYKYIC